MKARRDGVSKQKKGAAMAAKIVGFAGSSRFVAGLLLVLASAGSASAFQGTPEQRKACTPDVYRFCAGDIPNVRAITACLQRQKGSLSSACRAAMDQAGH
jgi:hypothetical protein